MNKEEKREYYVECPDCGKVWLVTDEDFEQERLECPNCGGWIRK